MDLWVEFNFIISIAKFKVLCRKVYVITTYHSFSVMMHFKKRSEEFPFLLPVSLQLHLNRAHLGSLATVKELIHIGNAHLKILRYDLGAFLERIKDNGMIKYSRDLHRHEQLVIMLTFAERTLNLLCKRTYTHKSLKPHGSFEETKFFQLGMKLLHFAL